MIPPGGDHAAAQFRWEILIKCGDPAVAAVGAAYSSDTTRNGWFGMPDNIAFDSQGRLWVATDGNRRRAPPAVLTASGASKPKGPRAVRRGTSIACRSAPNCAGRASRPTTRRCSSPCSIPAEGESSGEPSTFEEPSTRWPDFKPDMPPRPSVVAITKRGGGKIAT